MGETFYSALGVDPDADTERIKEAYRGLVKDHHPDVSDDDDAAEMFKRLTEARDVLVDPSSRSRYDRLGHDTYVSRHLDSNAWTADEPAARSGDGTSTTGSSSRTHDDRSTTGGTGRRDATAGRDDAGASRRSRERRRGRQYGGWSTTDDTTEPGGGGDWYESSGATGTEAGDPFEDAGGAWTTDDEGWSTTSGSTRGRADDRRKRARADGWRQRHAAADAYSPSGREPTGTAREHASTVERLRSALRDIGPWLAFHFAFLVSAFVTIWLLMSWTPSVMTMLVSFVLLGCTVFFSILHMISRVYS